MRAALAVLLPPVLAVALLLPGRAGASHLEVEISAPREARVGEEVQIRVALRSADGTPAADAPVALYREASFGGASGLVELARALTDDEGVAVLTYEPRLAGDLELTVQYAAPDGETESTTIAMSVAEGPQLHRSAAGIQVPGLNVWLLIAVLAAVWGILFAAALFVVAIARAGAEGAVGPAGSRPSATRAGDGHE